VPGPRQHSSSGRFGTGRFDVGARVRGRHIDHSGREKQQVKSGAIEATKARIFLKNELIGGMASFFMYPTKRCAVVRSIRNVKILA
jgi:hypothetical protein